MNKNVSKHSAVCSKSHRASPESPHCSLGQTTAKFCCFFFQNVSWKLSVSLHSYHLIPSHLHFCSGPLQPSMSLCFTAATFLSLFHTAVRDLGKHMIQSHLQCPILHGFLLGLDETVFPFIPLLTGPACMTGPRPACPTWSPATVPLACHTPTTS